MAQDFKSEVIVSYEKTIANMEEFKKFLRDQINDVSKANAALSKHQKEIDDLVGKYESLTEAQAKERAMLQKQEREHSKEIKAQERIIAQKKREREAIERNLASYDKEYAAKRKIEKASKDLLKAQENGYISEQKRITLLKEVEAANNLQAKTIDTLSQKYIKGYSVNKKYLETLKELFQANRLSVIDQKQLNEEITKVQKAMEGGYSSTKELSKSTSKLSKDIHNLNLEYDKSYAMQVKYSKEFLKLQKAYNTTSMSTKEFERRQDALNAEIARGGVTLKELRKQQLATAKSNREFRMSYDSSFASLRKYKEETKILQKQLKLGIIDKDQLNAKIKELDKSYKHNWQTIEDVKEANLKLAKSQHELRLEFDKSYAASFKYQQGLDKLQKAMAAGSMSDDNYIRRLKLLNEELKRGGQSHAQYREQQKKTIAKVREQAESLKALKAAHDPLYAAREKFKKQEAELKVLLESKNIDQNKFNETLQRYRDQLAKTLRTTNNSINAKKRERIELEKIAEKYDTVYAAEKRYSITKRELERLLKANIITGKQFNDMLKVQEMKLKAAQGAGKGLINRLFRMRTAFKETGIAASISRTYVAALHKTWKAFFAIMAVQTFARWSTEFAKTGENIELMSRKLKHFTGEANNLPIVSESANRVGLDFDILNKTLTRFAITTRGAFDIKTMIKWTESLVKAGRVAGTTTQELSSGLLQLSQAMSAGRLMGDEYRSISENMPLLKQSIEDVFKEMGMGNVSLKNMSREGEITTEVLIKAFGKLGSKVEGMGDTWDTIDAAISRLLVQWQLFVYQLTKGNSIFKELINSFARGLKFVRESLFGKLSDETESFVTSSTKAVETSSDLATNIMKLNDTVSEVSSTVSSATSSLSSLASSMFGVNEAFASSTDEVKKTNTALTVILQTLTFIVGGRILAKIAKFAFGFTGITKTVSVTASILTNFKGEVGKLMLRFGIMAGKLVNLIKIFKNLFSVIKLNPIGLLATGLIALGGYLVSVYSDTRKLKEQQDKLNETIFDSVEKFNLYEQALRSTGEAMKSWSRSEIATNIKVSEKLLSDVEMQLSKLLSQKAKYEKALNSNRTGRGGAKEKENAKQNLNTVNILIKKSKEASVYYTKLLGESKKAFDSFNENLQKSMNGFTNIWSKIGTDDENKKILKLSKSYSSLQNEIVIGSKALQDEFEKKLKGSEKEKALLWAKQQTEAQLNQLRINFSAEYTKIMEKNKKNIRKTVKELSKLKKAEAQLAEIRKAGIKGKQLQDAIDEVNKWNGVAEMQKKKEVELKKSIDDYSKSLEFNNRELAKTNPLLADYVKKVNELSAKKALEAISQEEYNKQLEREQILLKEAQTEQETNRIESLREKYSSVYSAQKQYNETLKQVNELYKKGLITSKEYAQSMLEVRASVIEAKAAQGDLAAILEKGSMKTVDDMGTNFKDTFREVLDGNEDAFKNFNERMLNSFKDMLADIAYEALVKPIIVDIKTQLIGGSGALGQAANTAGGGIGGGSTGGLLGKAFSGIGDLFSKSFNLFSGNMAFANGAAFQNGVQAFADGGVIGSPTFFPMSSGTGLMGEDGPEAIVPLKRGKNGKLGIEGGGSTTNVNVTINVNGTNGNSEAIRKSAAQVAQAAGQATNRALRRNG